MSINVVCLSGNVTRDAELRQVGSGTCLEFSVAVNDRRKNQSGEWEDVPNYFDCCMWGKRAEAVAGMVTKGKQVMLEGRLHWRQWDAKDGTRRSKVEVTVAEIVFPPKPKAHDDEAFGWFE